MCDKSFVGSSSPAARLSAAFASIVLATVLLAAAPLRADYFNWVGTSGDWSTPGNWSDLSSSGGTLPGSGDSASIANSGTATITQSGGLCSELYLLTGTVKMTGGNFSTADNQYLSGNGMVIFTQSGGTNTIAGNGSLILGNNSGSGGAYSLSGAGQLIAPNEQVGVSGSGTMTQTGGTNNVSGALSLGTNLGSNGTYNLSGNGQLIAPSESVGFYGTGAFVQSGGTNSVSYLSLGSGTYNLSGSGQLAAFSETIGFYGTGTFTQSGGTNAVTNSLTLGYGAGSSGTYNLNGGLLIVPLLSPSSTAASFNFSGGTLQASNGFSADQPMMLGVSGGGATFDTAGHAVTLSGSFSGPGSLTKIGSGALTLAVVNTYSGNTLISGGTLVLGNSLSLQGSTLDTSGTGVLNIGSLTSVTLGGLTGPGNFALTNTASAALSLNVGNNGANTTYSGALQGTGSLSKIGSGTLLLGGSNTYTGSTAVKAGTLQFASTAALPGYATPGAISVTGGAALAVSAGGSGWKASDIDTLLASNRSGFASGSFLGIDTSGGSLSYSTSLTGSIGLEKLGSNALILSGTNLYNGGTMVYAGTLVLANKKAIADGSRLTVGAGAAAIFNASEGETVAHADSLTQVAAVPEPGTLALAGAAGIVAGLYKAMSLLRFRRSAASRRKLAIGKR